MRRPILTSVVRVTLAGVLMTALVNCAGGEEDVPARAPGVPPEPAELQLGPGDLQLEEPASAAPSAQTVGASTSSKGTAADPECETGIVSGGVCCAAECGECGGAGCSQRPGGTASCCTGAIGESGVSCAGSGPPCLLGELPPPPAPAAPDPECETGIVSGGVCCAAECGECGGAGCSQRPGGTASCCTGAIGESGVSCAGSGPPCSLAP